MLDMESASESVNDAIKKLRSQDVLTQNEGVQELIQIGRAAAPALLSLLGDVSAGEQNQTNYVMSPNAEAEERSAVQQGPADLEERGRGYAGVGVCRRLESTHL